MASLVYIFVGSGFNGYYYLAALNVFFNLSAFYFILTTLNLGLNIRIKLSLPFFFQALWFALVPALNETFYWLSGMPYTWTATLGLWATGCFLKLSRSYKAPFHLIAFFLLIFVNSMILEQSSAMQIIVLFATGCVLWSSHRKVAKIAFIGFFIACLGLALMYFAPGTSVRMSISSDSGNIIRSLLVSFTFGGITSFKFFLNPFIYILLLYLPDVSQRIVPFYRSPFIKF